MDLLELAWKSNDQTAIKASVFWRVDKEEREKEKVNGGWDVTK